MTRTFEGGYKMSWLSNIWTGNTNSYYPQVLAR